MPKRNNQDKTIVGKKLTIKFTWKNSFTKKPEIVELGCLISDKTTVDKDTLDCILVSIRTAVKEQTIFKMQTKKLYD